MSNHKTSPCMTMALLFGVSLALIGCSQPVTTVAPTGIIAPSHTPAPIAPTATIPPTAAPATPTPDWKATVAACRPMAQVTDVTTPDSSVLKPGEKFAQVWRLLSAGNCAWDKGAALVFMGGEKLSAPDSIPVNPVQVGESVEISVTLEAPRSLGAYVGVWALRQPSGQIITTTDVRVVVLVPTPTAGAPAISPARPTAIPRSSSIPPVGSGPFSADESASGPWNCYRTQPSWPADWVGDFYIGVRGGPGNYTISDPAHCQWNFGEQKFVCRYSARVGVPIMLMLQVSCPGCTPQTVALYGRGSDSREEGPGICRIQGYQLSP